MRQLLRRAWYVIRRRQFEQDLAEELEFHRQMGPGRARQQPHAGHRPEPIDR